MCISNVPCLVLKCVLYTSSSFLAVVPYSWWYNCFFCNASRLIQCRLWWVSNGLLDRFVTVWGSNAPLYGVSTIVRAGKGWTMALDGLIWAMIFIGPIKNLFHSFLFWHYSSASRWASLSSFLTLFHLHSLKYLDLHRKNHHLSKTARSFWKESEMSSTSMVSFWSPNFAKATTLILFTGFTTLLYFTSSIDYSTP